MPRPSENDSFEMLHGRIVVLDLASPYVCIGKLVASDALYLHMIDADLHDFRDNPITREVYVFDSARLGIRRNRKEVWVSRSEVVAVTPFDAISES